MSILFRIFFLKLIHNFEPLIRNNSLNLNVRVTVCTAVAHADKNNRFPSVVQSCIEDVGLSLFKVVLSLVLKVKRCFGKSREVNIISIFVVDGACTFEGVVVVKIR